MNTEDINKYYKKVNDLIDSYIVDWNIVPSKLGNYLKPGSDRFNKFIVKTGLADIDGIKKIIMDVIEDRKSIELDGIMKFEKFISINEGLLDTKFPTIEHEKVLADYYNTSIGHIEMLDSKLHLYTVKDFGITKKVIIFSNSELTNISSNIKNESFNSIKNKFITVKGINDFAFGKLGLDKILDENKYKENFIKIFNNEMLLKYIVTIFSNELSEKNYNYIEFSNYNLWEIN